MAVACTLPATLTYLILRFRPNLSAFRNGSKVVGGFIWWLSQRQLNRLPFRRSPGTGAIYWLVAFS